MRTRTWFVCARCKAAHAYRREPVKCQHCLREGVGRRPQLAETETYFVRRKRPRVTGSILLGTDR